MEWHDYVGGLGVATLLVTYLLLQVNRIAAQSLLYSQLNAIGAFLIMVSLWQDFNMSAFIMESSWFVISLIGAAVTIGKSGDNNSASGDSGSAVK